MDSVVSFSIASSVGLRSRSSGSDTPTAPRLHMGNKLVSEILRNLEKAQRSKVEKRPQRIEKLVHMITYQLKRAHAGDHLLQTTSIWALINVYRLEPEVSKEIMMFLGVPGVLVDILKSGLLSGATRQYASELCYFLCSSDPYPTKRHLDDQSSQGPLVLEKYAVPAKHSQQSVDEMYDGASDISSLMEDDYKGFRPFEPYRINDENMHKLTSLFSRKRQAEFDLLGMEPALTEAEINDDDSIGGSSISSHSEVSYRDKGFGVATRLHTTGSARECSPHQKRSLYGELAASRGPQFRASMQSITRAVARPATSGAVHDLDTLSHLTYGSSASVDRLPPPGKPAILSTKAVFRNVRTRKGSPRGKKASPHRVMPLDLNTSSVMSASIRNLLRRSNNDSAVCDPADVTGYLAKLDPLSLNVSAGYHATIRMQTDDASSLVSYSSEEEEEEGRGAVAQKQAVALGGSSGGDSWFDYGSSPAAEEAAPKMRIRAEKLIDLRFTKQLFNHKATIADSQSFITRLENLFEVMDKDKSGYVTWEAFHQVILNLAPPQLLRADVVAFVEAQCSDEKALIDYKEFVISGKVMVIHKAMKKSVLPINGWMERQRNFSGDATTYTWVNHVKWYRKRMSSAVIWLMRRASHAIRLYSVIENAKRYLQLVGRRARALYALLEAGQLALKQDGIRLAAKKRLMLRCYFARKHQNRVSEARRFLVFSALGIVKEQRVHDDAEDGITVTEYPEFVKQADFASIYRMQHLRRVALAFLKQRGVLAVVVMEKRAEAASWLLAYADNVMAQMRLRDKASAWLGARAGRAQQHCMAIDDNLQILLRVGLKAYYYLCRQEDSLSWLLQRTVEAQRHTNWQLDCLEGLLSYGQHKLQLLNAREASYAYLCKRRRNAQALLERKVVAYAWLARLGPAYYRHEQFVEDAFAYLVDRGAAAHRHIEKTRRTQQVLASLGTRSRVRKLQIQNAVYDLQQLGQYAKLKFFEAKWVPVLANQSKVNEEKARIVSGDKTRNKSRKDMNLQDRWKTELKDCFNFVLTFSRVLDDKTVNGFYISRLSFKRIILGGKLVGMDPSIVDHEFQTIDVNQSGCITFDELWHWFEIAAFERHRHLMVASKGKGKGLLFTFDRVFSPADRAIAICANKFDSTAKSEEEEDFGAGFTKNRRFDSDSEEEEEEEVEEVEENDIKEFLRLQKKYFEEEARKEEALLEQREQEEKERLMKKKLEEAQQREKNRFKSLGL